LVLQVDTRDLPVNERLEALTKVLTLRGVPQNVRLLPSARQPHHLVAATDLGGGVSINRNIGTGFLTSRSGAQMRVSAPERIMLGIQLSGLGRLSTDGNQAVVPAGELVIIDESRSFEYGWWGDGGIKAITFGHSALGLSSSEVRAATFRLSKSPMYLIVRAHLALLGDDKQGHYPQSGITNQGTERLVRALVATASHSHSASEVMAEALLDRVCAYALQHLGDPTLSPSMIAAAHSISLRQLYKIWPDDLPPVAEWIMESRLIGARAQLERAAYRTLPISAIARSWGFSHLSHFSRRFKETYGTTATDWRRRALG
jgi:AraC-like DNA-binding protein